jgi:hypothetical protein
MQDKFRISVAIAIFARTSNDTSLPTKCAFYDKDGSVYLPNAPLTADMHANQVAINLIKTLIPVDIRLLSITPLGFFDPIIEDPAQRADREIILGYRVIVSPGMPVLQDLEFKDHEQLRIALERVSANHFRVFRLGLCH